MGRILAVLPLFFVITLALFLRLYGINWDQWYHLHPDERMLIMVADRIHFFSNFNPDFFNYGSLPIYILKGSGQLLDSLFHTFLSDYNGLLIVGRSLSVIFDIGTLILVYLIAYTLFNKSKIALISAFFYAIAFFPIQNSHFFVVDVFLTFFITLLIYALLLFIKKPLLWKQLLISLSLAAAFATKFTAIIFYPLTVVTIIVALCLYHKSWSKRILYMFFYLVVFHIGFLALHFLFMPYAYLAYERYYSDITQQVKMNSNPYIFPYTLQYVATTPYIYHLKNLALWGLGPIISLLALGGLLGSIYKGFLLISHSPHKHKHLLNFIFKKICSHYAFIFFILMYALYFLIIGRSAVKFMRYLLPMYPFFIILAAYCFYQIQKSQLLLLGKYPHKSVISSFIAVGLLLGAIIWSISFVNIYSYPHTRIAATEWINANIPNGSTVAVEHWDDRLPLQGTEKYSMIDLNLYDQPDSGLKWSMMEDKLRAADYIIIASNRLYVPLQTLTDCNKYTSCYPTASQYYKDLFSGSRGFVEVKTFEAKPTFPLLPIFSVDDQAADESFTVYDHPKIIIFQKISK